MSYDDPLIGQNLIDVRTEAALFAHEHAGEGRHYPWHGDDEYEYGYPANADEYNEQESENHQGQELDVWPYDDQGYLAELTLPPEDDHA